MLHAAVAFGGVGSLHTLIYYVDSRTGQESPNDDDYVWAIKSNDVACVTSQQSASVLRTLESIAETSQASARNL
jgi:hypothetical protein